MDLILLAAEEDTNAVVMIVIALGIIVGILAVFAVLANFFWLWAQSFTTQAGIGLLDLVGMRFRRVDARTIVRSKIMAVQAGMSDADISSEELEAHYLAGGNVPQVIRALVAARKSQIISLEFDKAAAIDLAGRDVLEAVQTSVYPKVIDCPPKGAARSSLDAMAKDGIQMKVKARVTVRANLEQLVGGATEETIIARVGEGIVSAIGSAEVHTEVLENPDVISKAVLAKRLDAQTAFQIVSIDIADIDIGENIGARLQADTAEADMRVARARAESRRAAAVAVEQEMMARIEESKATLVEAEADVPRAMADAFNSGQLQIMDYYKLMNVDADTKMRASIADAGEHKKPVENVT
ncbi:MAG: flotillin-like protein FloA [Aureliella sp.]